MTKIYGSLDLSSKTDEELLDAGDFSALWDKYGHRCTADVGAPLASEKGLKDEKLGAQGLLRRYF